MAVVCVLPMCLVTDISTFRYASVASIISVLYVTVEQMVGFFSKVDKIDWNLADKNIAPVHWDRNILTGMNINFFSFSIQVPLV